MSKERACGNSECGTSTGIHEGLTFGHGELDRNGYWEFPCRVCAEAWDKNIKQTRDEIRDDMIARGNLPLNVVQYILGAEWLWLHAWPLARTDIAAHTAEAQARIAKEKEYDDEFKRLYGDMFHTDPPEGEAA